MRKTTRDITFGIDASNIRAGGGLTHLTQLLEHANPEKEGIKRVVVWGNKHTLAKLPERHWLRKIYSPLLDWPLPFRLFWQQIVLPGLLKMSSCNALFSPGGTLPLRLLIPGFVMSQNLLPFEKAEAARYGWWSFTRQRLALLARAQSNSFARAQGIIFLSGYARDAVLAEVKKCPANLAVIPHGVDKRFFCEPRPSLPLEAYSPSRPFKLTYVSIVDVYKHQWQVARAVGQLRKEGYPISIDFIGPAYPLALRRLRQTIREIDPEEVFLNYKGAVPYGQLHGTYREADAFVFASSCENLPIILLEAMASGLPIACSNRGPMREILGEAGIYFDPETPEEIQSALRRLMNRQDLREQLAWNAYLKAQRYSWERCAKQTFSFFAKSPYRLTR